MKVIDNCGNPVPRGTRPVETFVEFENGVFEIKIGQRDDTSNTGYADERGRYTDHNRLLISEFEAHPFEWKICGKERTGMLHVQIIANNAIRITFICGTTERYTTLLHGETLAAPELKITTVKMNLNEKHENA